MNTEDRPATRDTDSPYPREGLELVVPEDTAWMFEQERLFWEERRRSWRSRFVRSVRRLPGWLARLVGLGDRR